MKVQRDITFLEISFHLNVCFFVHVLSKIDKRMAQKISNSLVKRKVQFCCCFVSERQTIFDTFDRYLMLLMNTTTDCSLANTTTTLSFTYEKLLNLIHNSVINFRVLKQTAMTEWMTCLMMWPTYSLWDFIKFKINFLLNFRQLIK